MGRVNGFYRHSSLQARSPKISQRTASILHLDKYNARTFSICFASFAEERHKDGEMERWRDGKMNRRRGREVASIGGESG
jgi:hypothetical protein